MVTGSERRTVPENTTAVATYSARDPEGAASTFTWTLAGDDAGAFALSQTGVLTFDPAPDFEAHADLDGDDVYEVTVQATDDSATEPDAMTGELEVEVTVEDVDEPPEIIGDASYTIAENGPTFIGAYTATDPEGGDATWEPATGADSRHFDFDLLTGRLSFADTPDYDRATNGNHGPTYRITLQAADEGRRFSMFAVTVTLTDVPEGPLISGPTEVTLDEVVNPTPGQVVTVGAYTKLDPEGSSSNWARVGQTAALTGADADRFEFDKTSGRLTFADRPDYEVRGSSYEVVLNANDGVLNSRLEITVDVANVDERDMQPVKLGAQRGVINVPLTATLTDPDTVVSANWRWARSASRTSGWSDIAGATSSSYTPAGDDRDHYLRAAVGYEDGHGPNKSASAVTEFTTANERASNTPPVLPDSVDDIMIPEDTPPGRNVGSAIVASDAENDRPVYSLSGASEFVIGRTAGQIRVADGVTFDYEQGQRSYALTVTADDGFGGADSVGVTIRIEDVNEAPVAVGDAPRISEDTPVTIDVLANDSDPESDALSLLAALPGRPRWGTATVDTTTNRITYTPRANYHGADTFSYRVQDDGSPRLSSTATVSITVDPVNDAPMFASATAERSVAETAGEGGNVGAPVVARDVDEGDTLSYRLSGADAFAFDIDGDGQITVAAGVTFDIATQDTYDVTVTATDDGTPPRSANVDVTITVTTGPVGPIFTGGSSGGGFGAFGGAGGPSGPEPSDQDFEWTVKHDIEALAGTNDAPTGAWSNGATLWVLDNAEGAGDAVYAYEIERGRRVEEREFALHETNRAPRGAWSDGKGTLWVSDSGQDRLFAYELESGERVEGREIALAGRNRDARGIWSDGMTMWVLDGGNDSVFAYDLESGDLLAEYALADANGDPHGIWSDHVTLWVSDHGAKRLLAYRLPQAPGSEETDEDLALDRVSEEDFTEPGRVGNNSPRGLWSDGDVMYVADANDGKVYTYNMPDAIDARLASLSLNGVDIGEFDPDQPDYEGVAGEGVSEMTVEARAVQDGATVTIEPADADEEAAGHQVALAGLEAITVTVTSADGSRERVYRVVLPDAEEPAPCLRGAVSVGFSLVVAGGGSLDDLVACAEGRHVTALYALHAGEYVPYIVGAPAFVNARFAELYADGVPALTVLTASSDGPATPAPAAHAVTAPLAVCLRGEIGAGFSLMLYEGGSVEDLAACASSLGVTAVYALAGGEYVPYIAGAPEFVNSPFFELFADGVPPLTPLIARASECPPRAPTGDRHEAG